MSEREEEREKNNCPSRGLGLGLAAAAIGVGVGAALYYFINKRENPNNEGATEDNWTCESPQTLYSQEDNSDNSYITISENTTTDVSLLDDSFTSRARDLDWSYSDSDETDFYDESEAELTEYSVHSSDFAETDSGDSAETTSSNSDWMERDVFSPLSCSSSDSSIPSVPLSKRKKKRNEELRKQREAVFRERSWTLEECSICFDVILRDQEVMSLPCTHNFHSKCILPWLQEQQNCPNCRKAID